VDINTIRAWWGPVSLSSTNIYAKGDLERKAKALASGEIQEVDPTQPWRQDQELKEFLRSL
jgi:hypothetical protein